MKRNAVVPKPHYDEIPGQCESISLDNVFSCRVIDDWTALKKKKVVLL